MNDNNLNKSSNSSSPSFSANNGYNPNKINKGSSNIKIPNKRNMVKAVVNNVSQKKQQNEAANENNEEKKDINNNVSGNTSEKKDDNNKAKDIGSDIQEISKKGIAGKVLSDLGGAGEKIGQVMEIIKKIKFITAFSTPLLLCLSLIIVILVPIFCVMSIFGSSDVSNGSSGGSAYNSKSCDFNKISAILLSKTEFRDKLQGYAKSKSSNSNLVMFASYADNIYDYSLKYRINPELVVVRAKAEGYSPGKELGGVPYNNYWGIRCYNNRPLTECMKFSSLDDGIKYYSNLIKKNETLFDMFYISHYAYIGSSWDKGSCSYFEIVKDYYQNSKEAQASKKKAINACVSPNGSVKTTDHDQYAYSVWQVENMTTLRNEIFGDINCSDNVNNENTSDGEIDISEIKTTENISKIFNGNISEFLKNNNSSLKKYNSFISSSVKKVGVSTREGVAAAGIALIDYMANYGYKLRYTWGGKSSIYGVKSETGTVNLDCSGFVSWAIHNGGFKYYYKDSGGWGDSGKKCLRTDSKCIGKIGDLIWHNGHIMLIVGVEKNYYYVAEAASRNSGMKLTKQSIHSNAISNKTDYIVDMTDYYNKVGKVDDYPR